MNDSLLQPSPFIDVPTIDSIGADCNCDKDSNGTLRCPVHSGTRAVPPSEMNRWEEKQFLYAEIARMRARLKEIGLACQHHPENRRFSRNGTCHLCVNARNLARYHQHHPKKPKEVLALGLRRCSQCKVIQLEAEEFSKCGSGKRRSICKTCQRPKERKPMEQHIRRTGNRIEYEYSHPMRCPKCQSFPIRFRRRTDADLKLDSWQCTRGCQIRISHVKIAIDQFYQPSIPSTEGTNHEQRTVEVSSAHQVSE